MPEQEFQLEITDQSAFVRLSVSGKTRFFALASLAGVTALLICPLFFLPGTHGSPSMWHGLSTSSIGSAAFLGPFFLLLSVPLLMVVGMKRYVTLAYPSDEIFRADRSTLSISRVRWLDVHNNHWDTCSFSLAEVRELRYQAIARLKGGSVYGLRFLAGGKTRRVLPGLEPRDAEKILMALKSFGADVPDDTVLRCKLNEGNFP
jgi:hypothetical protein